MPTFTVLRRQDAYADYHATVEADSANEAVEIARDDDDLVWEAHGVTEFDANLFVALDEDGNEIDGSAAGKLA